MRSSKAWTRPLRCPTETAPLHIIPPWDPTPDPPAWLEAQAVYFHLSLGKTEPSGGSNGASKGPTCPVSLHDLSSTPNRQLHSLQKAKAGPYNKPEVIQKYPFFFQANRNPNS